MAMPVSGECFIDDPFTFSMVDSAFTGMTLVSFPLFTIGLITGVLFDGFLSGLFIYPG